MYFFYNILTTLAIIISPIIIIYRILKGKEDLKRVGEKFSIYSQKKNNKKVWIHAASVGELMSIIPIIRKLEKNSKIKNILLSTSTTSSAKIFNKLKLKKTSHVYFPLDNNYIVKRFINYWQPKLAIFIDSEIWPNMFKNLYLKDIPIIIMNARITERSFNKWQIFPKFAKKVFGGISLALPQNLETLKYLKLLKVKNIKIAGNLKYYGQKNNQDHVTKLLENKFRDFKVWCAASTHYNEEILIGKLHKKLKKKEKRLITIIIPRHISRTNEIKEALNKLNLSCISHSSNQKIQKNTDIYLVDSYGESSKFYNLTNVSFVGGSIIKHGGQNPLEPARLGNYIISGPNVKNFKEIYAFLNNLKMSSFSSDILKMENLILKKLKNKTPNKNIKKIIKIGNDVLEKNLFYINKYLI
ncbi:3-deoxy-D-manno-octulosonic acid transferase [Candidatus Pelagibacter sp.]|jgi:3-deoxy-D-manno-octulosonic-acid transferase|uniref:3-deoxy-D-manno-octulosonic acid transferase n=1 Tax=uncultured Candidatus Pelagibacter sp. TaxID=372654 RepID=UPI002335536E|nr:glycosyltransferase N-terminal domain-containing protein [uncultured Candidatus Pelagibacter sp.]MDB4811727.1 3-deoxy-D-manno-octulosonic acid transferase [Candidatus Pelagibacter sp.]